MKKITGTICILLLITLHLNAKTSFNKRLISGKVISEQTELGIPGVNIKVEGYNLGSITNAEGKFVLLVPEQASGLSFSMNGYYEENIVLTEASKELKVILSARTETLLTSKNRVKNIHSGSKSEELYACLWDDMEKDSQWEDFMLLLIDEGYDKLEDQWGIYVENRLTIYVENASKRAIPNATVTLFSKKGKLLWKSITDQEGKAEMWPDIFELQKSDKYKAVVTYNEREQEFKSIKAGGGVYHLIFKDSPTVGELGADIVFTGSVTESSAEDLANINSVLKGTVNKIPFENESTLSSVFYQGNDPNGINQDFIKSFEYNNQVSTIDASYEYALARLVEMYEWSLEKKARILFWAVDKLPSAKFSNKTLIHSTIKQAAAKGIQIVPIVTKSVDKETEFFLRFVANATNGEYIFLTEKENTDYVRPSIGSVKATPLSVLLENFLIKEIGSKQL